MLNLLMALMLHRPPSRQCRFGPVWTARAVTRTIRCAEYRFPVPGGARMALCIARRESGLFARANNPSSSALGIYQVIDSTWASWWAHAPKFRRRYALTYDRTNARSNVMLSVRTMSQSLAPWGGGC